METWWIIKYNGRIIISVFGHQSAIGPYWSAGEALKMIEKWR